jgi:hypothetical protein
MEAVVILAGICEDADHVAELRAMLDRWRAAGVEVTRDDLLEAIERHNRVQALTRARTGEQR